MSSPRLHRVWMSPWPCVVQGVRPEAPESWKVLSYPPFSEFGEPAEIREVLIVCYRRVCREVAL